jgi:RNA recognition motif-containing protein
LLPAQITGILIILFLNFCFMNMYVSNLSFHTTDDNLRELFGKFGTVSSAKIITDRETGRSRGFGFVEMAEEKEARDAIQGLNNKEIEGRPLSVSIAKEKKPNNKRW